MGKTPGLQKSQLAYNEQEIVIPAKAGIQGILFLDLLLDSCFRRNDEEKNSVPSPP